MTAAAPLEALDREVFARHLLDACRIRLEDPRRTALEQALERVAAGVGAADFCAELSRLSRHIPKAELQPTATEQSALQAAGTGLDTERWGLRESARVLLILALPDLAEDSGLQTFEEACRYSDEGELRALLRSLALLPGPERFLDRAREGCRTNMTAVFEATACDTPYPALHFDETAWKQALLKSLFVGAPLSRIHGIDGRLSMDLTRMALDYADERRSAGRAVPPELWQLVGVSGGERSLLALSAELEQPAAKPAARLAVYLALSRAGLPDELASALEREGDAGLRRLADQLLAREPDVPDGPRPGASAFRSVLELPS